MALLRSSEIRVTPRPSPGEEYASRLAARQARVDELTRRERLLSVGRGIVFLGGAIAWFVAMGAGAFSVQWVWLAVAAFVALVIAHETVIRRRTAADRAATYYRRGLDRLEGRWAGHGEPGTRFLGDAHPYAADLDLFGRGSLFELLCRARTRSGQQTLAGWLAAPSAPASLRERQAAVEELRGRLDLREDLALLGDVVRAGVEPEALVAWGRAPAVAFPPGAHAVALGLAVANGAAVAAWAQGLDKTAPILIFALSAAFARWLGERVDQALHSIEKPGHDLALLSRVLERIERERFETPALVRLRSLLDTDGTAPSRHVAQLSRLLDQLDWKRNFFFAPFAALLFWTTQIALAVEAFRRTCGPRIADWLAAVGEIEALCSLAGQAFEHPDDPFPELLDTGAVFDAEGLGHPLLPLARCVRNDLRLDLDHPLLLVSGSNMSGKSTLLRTVGTNLVLARAGAPVRARRLRISPLTLGASIRVQDSLEAGVSRFYAEITRIRQIMDLAREAPPLLFLLDEVLHGTNSGDRRTGAEAIVRGLLSRGALGLVTTHDLALAAMAESLGPRARNVHFEDHLEDGRIAFDYRMHEGVVRKSNALALMRAVGLDV